MLNMATGLVGRRYCLNITPQEPDTEMTMAGRAAHAWRVLCLLRALRPSARAVPGVAREGPTSGSHDIVLAWRHRRIHGIDSEATLGSWNTAAFSKPPAWRSIVLPSIICMTTAAYRSSSAKFSCSRAVSAASSRSSHS